MRVARMVGGRGDSGGLLAGGGIWERGEIGLTAPVKGVGYGCLFCIVDCCVGSSLR